MEHNNGGLEDDFFRYINGRFLRAQEIAGPRKTLAPVATAPRFQSDSLASVA